MTTARDLIVDALDIESFLLCESEPEAKELIAKLMQSLGLTRHVRFLGFRDDAASLCVAMDAFVLPSLWEHMPLALGEAMRAGLPVVTTPWAGAEAFVDDGVTGVVAADFSVEAFAAALDRLRDEPRRRALAERGRAFADRRFDLERNVRRHIELYAELTGARP